jgi:hypothetical protein
VFREGEIIVAEVEETKTGDNKIRFSKIDPEGRKSIIDARHIINPQTEYGEEFYKSVASSKRSAEFSPSQKKKVDPVIASMETRKSVIRSRLAIDPATEEQDAYRSYQKYSSVVEPPKKKIILDGRPRDTKSSVNEKLVFLKEAIARSLIEKAKPSESQSVERINPKISDPNRIVEESDSSIDRRPTGSFVPPADLPRNCEEVKKTYFIEHSQKIGEDVVPTLVELDYMYFKPKDEEEDSGSEVEKLGPLDPCESFYQECDQTKRGVPKIPNTKVFKRKIRKLKPEEQKRAQEQKIEISKLLDQPNLVPCEILEKTKEWSQGKPIYKKEIDFIQTKNSIPKEPEYIESKLDYYQLIEKNPEFNESIMFPERSVIRNYKPQPPAAQFNAFDSLNKSELMPPAKFLVAQGDDGCIRIFQLEYFEGNPLIETEAGRLSLPSDIESSQDGFKTMFRHSGNFNQAPVLEPQTSQIVNSNIFRVPSQRQSEMQGLAQKKVLGVEELAKFLDIMKTVPNAKIELYKQSPEEVKGRSIVEGGFQFASMTYTDRSSLLKQIGELQKQGKIVSCAPQTVAPKIKMEESIKLSALHSDENAKKSLLTEPKIKAVKLDETLHDKPLFQIVESKSVQKENSDDEESKDDPVTQLKEELSKLSNLSDGQVPFTEIAKKALENTDDVNDQKKILNKLAKEMQSTVKERGQYIDDSIFMPNGTSMVNNSIKSEIPFKRCEWMPLSELYKVDSS